MGSRAPLSRAGVYDAIVIGSGPLNLIEAAYLGFLGRKVLLLEERDRLGGAWGSIDRPGYPGLDIGCHIWDFDREAYRFLETGIGLPLAPLRPAPRLVLGRFFLPYDWKQVRRVLVDSRDAIARGQFRRTLALIARTQYHRIRAFPPTYRFPKGGAHELVTLLGRMLERAGVEVRSSQKVEAVRLEPRHGWAAVEVGSEWLETREVVIGSFISLPDLLVTSARVPASGLTEREVRHVNLVIADSWRRTFSYLRFLNHGLIQRATDVSEQMEHRGAQVDGLRVICVGVHDTLDGARHDDAMVDEIMRALRHLGLVSPEADVRERFWNLYRLRYLPPETIAALVEEFAPVLRSLSTSNFIVGVTKNLPRWSPVMQSSGFLARAGRGPSGSVRRSTP